MHQIRNLKNKLEGNSGTEEAQPVAFLEDLLNLEISSPPVLNSYAGGPSFEPQVKQQPVEVNAGGGGLPDLDDLLNLQPSVPVVEETSHEPAQPVTQAETKPPEQKEAPVDDFFSSLANRD